MGKLKSLIDFLPYYYKEADTYKVDGKGILERFLEICGTYLEDSISKDIEDTLDNIDIDKTPEYFLTYLWEMLGELPFAYPALIDPEKFEQYYNGLDSTLEMEAKKKLWELVNTSPLGMSKENSRNVLKYAITLMKIRGTKKFFETVFRFYGLKCEITDPVESTYKDQFSGVTTDYLIDSDTPRFDNLTTMDSCDRFDKYIGKCNQCLTVDINLENYGNRLFMGSEGIGVAGSNSILLFGKPTAFLDIVAGANDYNSRNFTSDNYKAFRVFRMVVEKYFDKYLPFNVSIGKLSIGSVELVDEYSIDVEDIESESENNYLPFGTYSRVRVKVNSTWEGNHRGYRVSRMFNPYYGDKVYYDEIFIIKQPGTLTFAVDGNLDICKTYSLVWYLPDKFIYKLEVDPRLTNVKLLSEHDPDSLSEYERSSLEAGKDYYKGKIYLNYYTRKWVQRDINGLTYDFTTIKYESSHHTRVLVYDKLNKVSTDITLGGTNLENTHILSINEDCSETFSPREFLERISILEDNNIGVDIDLPFPNRNFTIKAHNTNSDDPVYTYAFGDGIVFDITSDRPELDTLDSNDLKLINIEAITDIDTVVPIISNHCTFKPPYPGTYKFYCNKDLKANKDTITISVLPLAFQYDLIVDTYQGYLYRDPNSLELVPVKIGVLCKEKVYNFTDFRVRCLETGETLVCNTKRYFTFKDSRTYTLVCLGDPSKSVNIVITERTE